VQKSLEDNLMDFSIKVRANVRRRQLGPKPLGMPDVVIGI
jgi:hypothetical protein